ncbi:hypothetical protein, partial [Nocardia asiatica]|uniref:hypothetical protein n=1 Tax=Nocardia asiatica TaxID=209252 RepID=UPI0024565F39
MASSEPTPAALRPGAPPPPPARGPPRGGGGAGAAGGWAAGLGSELAMSTSPVWAACADFSTAGP